MPSELTARILQQLEDTVGRPNVINQINANALQQGDLDLLTGKGEHQFAIILPNTATEGTVRLAQQIQHLLQKLAIPHAATPAGQITVSLGIATTIPDLEASPEDFIQATERALYKAKSQGRNRYSIAPGWIAPARNPAKTATPDGANC